MAMKGFDPDFADLPDYIVKITERIWEGRGIGLIRRWYSEDCPIHTTMGPAAGAEATIAGTLETLNTLPQRRLLPEDIIWSGNEDDGFLSSHRLICPGVHKGDGRLGPPTGRSVVVRAIADCFCVENRIVEEWLIRDTAGLVLQIGGDPVAYAAALAAADRAAGKGPWHLEEAARLRAEGGFRPPVHQDHPAAALVRDTMAAIWRADLHVVGERYHPACSVHLPGFRTAYGHEQLYEFLFGYLAAFPDLTIAIEHSIAREDPGLPTRVATRWWFTGTHTGYGAFGPPSGATVLGLVVNHAHVVDGRIREEWMLVDEVAIRKQIALQRM
ncbi:ester cyclase [Salinarimonas soli]|uniref:Ester cyclase n=1 Tax=Salinarimonas soli TaxID=1638099 RepID=A0A5B2W171_9HYPH|nr:ester cyclase [Salinarimonas soli]KAA2244246.1 ester cyclase [Salinarimonas soli]